MAEKRSRKHADRLAKDVLDSSRGTVTDADVLRTLARWSFRKNQTRKNVRPKGLDHVHSDTLGLVSTRNGRVVLSKHTRANVLKLFAQWLRAHGPPSVARAFPCTSINVNYAYSAALHRDAGNRGPSVSKSFGSFSGGHLVYYPEDDGNTPLDDLCAQQAITLDAQKAVCLFDGCRAHRVTEFVGERYSLVFFTQSQYQKAAPADLDFLRDHGLEMPTEAGLRFFMSLLSPPKGYGQGQQQSIRRCLGLADKQPVISWKTVGLTDIGSDALQLAMSFVVQPHNIEALCSTSRCFDAAVKSPASWQRVRVDSAGWRPLGLAAHSHWKLWRHAELVVAAPWNHSNVALLMSKGIKCWRWVGGGGKFRLYRGHHVLVSQFSVLPTAVSMLITGCSRSPLNICISNVRDPYEILDCLAGAPREGRICVATHFCNTPKGSAFTWNGKPVGESGAVLPSALHGFVTIGLFMGLLKATVDGVCKAAVATGLRLPEDDWFVAMVADGSAPPQITAVPCWSME
jgi:hypothetical protein